MVGVLKIKVKESAEELRKKLQTATKAGQRGKIQILWWIKTGKAKTVQELSDWSGYHYKTVSKWLCNYRQEGLKEILKEGVKRGRKSLMPEEIRAALKEKLKQEEEGFRSYLEIQEWLKSEHGLELKYKTVHKIVRYDLKGKLKRPRPVSSKQNPEDVKTLKKTMPSSSCAI